MAVVGRVVCKAIVWNVPNDVALGQRKGFMVAKANSEDGRLWYYGCYEMDVRALAAAKEITNDVVTGIVLEVGYGHKTDT